MNKCFHSYPGKSLLKCVVCKLIPPFLLKQWLEIDTGVHMDPSHFRALSDGFTGEGVSCIKNQMMQERGSVSWRIRWNIGSGIPILTLLAPIEKLWGPRGPRTVVWGLMLQNIKNNRKMYNKNATWRWSEPTCLFHGLAWTGVHLQCTGSEHAVYAECRLHWLRRAYDPYTQVTTYTGSICVL